MSSLASPVRVLVEMPKGSRNKYRWDDGLEAIRFDRFLFSSVMCPIDYGFLLGALAEDGASLAAMVCVSAPTFAGCVITVKVIGVLHLRDEEGAENKVLGVPSEDPDYNEIDQPDDLGQQLRGEISGYFSVYKQLEGHEVTTSEWRSREDAITVIDQARDRYRTSRS